MADWILDADEVRTARDQIGNPRIYGVLGDDRALALCDTVDALRARLESAEGARDEARWREVTDTIPTSYHRCLVTNGRDIAIGNRTARDGRLTTAFITDSGGWVYAVTHWMPIPQLPALAEANERSRE